VDEAAVDVRAVVGVSVTPGGGGPVHCAHLDIGGRGDASKGELHDVAAQMSAAVPRRVSAGVAVPTRELGGVELVVGWDGVSHVQYMAKV